LFLIFYEAKARIFFQLWVARLFILFTKTARQEKLQGKKFNFFQNQNDTCAHLFTLVMKFHDRQSSERCTRKLISRHCLDFLFLITDDRDFRPQTCTNGLVFRECKHIKNIFEDVYFTKNLFHITLMSLTCQSIKSNHNLFVYTSLEQFHNISYNGCRHILYKESVNCTILIITYR
jgi:hypothetical protein